jgi:TetR/AcrR family transcriptional regulator, transcriptional repressor for nem operon
MARQSESKDKLLQVALELIWGQSYNAVSVDQICERAEVKKGSFYHFFPSKSDLTLAAYEDYWQACREKYDEIFSAQVPPLERLRRYCELVIETQERLFEATGRVLGCPFAAVGSELSASDGKIRAKSEEMFERMCRYFESALRDACHAGLINAQDFEGTARVIHSFVLGMLLEARIRNNPVGLRCLYWYLMRLAGGIDGEKIEQDGKMTSQIS